MEKKTDYYYFRNTITDFCGFRQAENASDCNEEYVLNCKNNIFLVFKVFKYKNDVITDFFLRERTRNKNKIVI
jgi:hypothetical protein